MATKAVGRYAVTGPVGGGRWQVCRSGRVLSVAGTEAEATAAATALEEEHRASRRADEQRQDRALAAALRRRYWRSPVTGEPGYACVCAESLGMDVVGRVGAGWRGNMTVSAVYVVYAAEGESGDVPEGWERADPRKDHDLRQAIEESVRYTY